MAHAPIGSLVGRASAHWTYPTVSRPRAGPLLGVPSLHVGAAAADANWMRRADAMHRDAAKLRACLADRRRCRTPLLRGWSRLVRDARSLAPAARIERVNREINRWIPYLSDRRRFGMSDYWASPGEVLGRGGDCEDYAIAKYWTLRQLGFAARSLRILVLRRRARRIYHAVLAVELGGRTLLLDNRSMSPRTGRELAAYVPVYSVNERHKWVHAAPLKIARTTSSKVSPRHDGRSGL